MNPSFENQFHIWVGLNVCWLRNIKPQGSTATMLVFINMDTLIFNYLKLNHASLQRLLENDAVRITEKFPIP